MSGNVPDEEYSKSKINEGMRITCYFLMSGERKEKKKQKKTYKDCDTLSAALREV